MVFLLAYLPWLVHRHSNLSCLLKPSVTISHINENKTFYPSLALITSIMAKVFI